jgi:uncharacterized OB-fold protein
VSAPSDVPAATTDRAGGPLQPLPVVTSLNEHFWHGGADGELRFLRCADCAWYVHPPRPICPRCASRNVGPVAVSGEGVVYTLTVNHQPWYPGQTVPYVVAMVELPEQAGLRLTTNIVGCQPEAVHIGMRVRVWFLAIEDVYLPLFEPVGLA